MYHYTLRVMANSNVIDCYFLCDNQLFWNWYALLDPSTSTTAIHRTTRKRFKLYTLMKHDEADATINSCAHELLRCAQCTAPKLCAAYETPDTLFMLLEDSQYDKILVD